MRRLLELTGTLNFTNDAAHRHGHLTACIPLELQRALPGTTVTSNYSNMLRF
jgi:hypothetical protein